MRVSIDTFLRHSNPLGCDLFFFLFFWVNPMGVGRASVYNNVSTSQAILFFGDGPSKMVR